MLMKSTGPACSRASALEEKLPAARGTNLLQAATTSSKGQEARSKKSGIRKQNQEAITSSKGQVLGAWVSSLELVSCGFRKERHGQLQAAGAIRPSLPRCFSVARSVLGAWGKQFGANFLWIQKGKVRPAAGRRCHPSFTATVFQCGEVRFGSLGKQFGANFLGSESDVRHGQLQAAGAIRP